MNDTGLGSLKEFLKGQKSEEAIALVGTAPFVATYGKGITRNFEKSIRAGNFKEAIELVDALSGFMTSAEEKLQPRVGENFGLSPLPDADW